MGFAAFLASVRRFGAQRRRLLVLVLVSALVVTGSTTALVVTAQAAAAEQARADAAAAKALEQKLVDYYLGALDRLQPFGTQLVDDATAWSTSSSPLLTAADVAGLTSTADAVADVMALRPPVGASSDELEDLFNAQWTMIKGARERYSYFVAQALAAAKFHLDAAPLADSATRQALVDAMKALESAEKEAAPLTDSLTALTAAATAADVSQHAAVAAAEAAAAAAAAAARRGSAAPRPGEPVCASSVLNCVNQVRAFYGLGALSSNGTLNAAAQTCAQRMHDANDMTHSSPTPGFGWWGENIAHGYGSQVSVFNAWMNSPGHRANILRPQFTYMGFGYVSDGNWWCQQFGS